mgnify:CR=1 FL=1
MADVKPTTEPQSFIEIALDEIFQSLAQTESYLRKLCDALEAINEALKSQEEVLDELRDMYRDYRDRACRDELE